MAEMSVSFAVNGMLPLLSEEASLLRGVHREFAEIKNELESIQSFLTDADRRANALGEESAGAKTWVKQVREVAFHLEDIIDEYIIRVGQHQQQPGCAAPLHKIVHQIKTLIPRHRIASEIQDIKSCVRGIKDRSDRYGFQVQPSFEQGSSSNGGSQTIRWYDPRTTALHMDEAEVVGIEAPKDELVGWLVRGRAERTVVAVVGMGGLGKTTLAKYVFDNHEVIGHFDCHAWITVSQSYTVERLLRDMLHKFCQGKNESPPEDILQMDRDSLINSVRNYLQQKRYVVVFDDVWFLNFLDEIQYAVIDDKNGSRILITTRCMEIAQSCKRSSPVEVHRLSPLTKEQSLELFCNKAFRFDFNERCPEELVDISSEFVTKSRGLPLAIVAIAGFLLTKDKNAIGWTRISQHLSSELLKDDHLSGVIKILGFSYDDLPYYLKSCFLYFGIYPQDFEIKSERLIRQWIAEGFVKEENMKTLEEVAEDYLAELIGRSLVQVSSVTVDGKAEVCRVHDIVYVMIRSKIKDLRFCMFPYEDDWSWKSRRLSVATISNDLMALIGSSHVRSLLFVTKEELPEHLVRRIAKNYKLKVLDFEHTSLNHVPKSLGNLIQLKYLSFKSTKIKSLPNSIGKLQSLETLDLRGTQVRVIPKEISKLRKLQHLLGTCMSLIKLKDNIGGMASLQTLNEVQVDEEGGVELIRKLGKARLLRALKLIGVELKHGSTLCSSITEMEHLEILHIDATIGQVIDLHFISPPCMLQDLLLRGKINKLPDWVPQLQNLVKLHMESSELTDDPLDSLQNMPNLLSLHLLDHSYEGENLHFQDGGFQNLKELYLEQLHQLSSIVIDRGALLSLKTLRLKSIPQLNTIPSGIQHLEELEVLEIHSMSTEFNKSIVPDGGLEHPAIKHVPLVQILTQHPLEGIKSHTIHHSGVRKSSILKR